MHRSLLSGALVALAGWTDVATAALAPRDLDGNPTTIEALYDAQQDVTWLWNWDYQGAGRLTWELALDWASSLVVGGVSGWALPSVAQYESIREMTREFDNVRAGLYWSSEEYGPSPWRVWVYEPIRDRFDSEGKTRENFVTAVRAGDAGQPVPEPSSTLLALMGVAALLASCKRRHASQARLQTSQGTFRWEWTRERRGEC